MKDLLDEYGFDSEPINFSPECRGALTGETGFLTPEDLVDFDAALDTFINGAYYKCPVSAADLVDKVDALKHEREYVFYNMMLQVRSTHGGGGFALPTGGEGFTEEGFTISEATYCDFVWRQPRRNCCASSRRRRACRERRRGLVGT